MLSVLKPSLNRITQSYSTKHTGYDHDDVPDKRYFASFDGTVSQVINEYSTSWLANTPTDPWYPGLGKPPRALKTADYGNFLKIVSDRGIVQLAAHFPKGGILVHIGQQVKAGQLIAIPPNTQNDTGNSTGGHTHTEYRNPLGISMAVDFSDHSPVTVPTEEPMNYEELFKKYEALAMRYKKFSFGEFDAFMKEHLGETGEGGHLQSERVGRLRIAQELGLTNGTEVEDILKAIKSLNDQIIQLQQSNGSINGQLPGSNSDIYTVPGFKLKQIVFEKE